MTGPEWAVLYFGGMLLAAFCALTGRGDYVEAPGSRWSWLVTAAGVVLWPLILPFSFLALFGAFCYCGLAFTVWVFEKMGGEFTVYGQTVTLPKRPV